jgi:ribonuclease Z
VVSGGGPIVSRNCSSLTLNIDGTSWCEPLCILIPRPELIVQTLVSIVFDCAEGTQLQIQRSSLKLSRIERIFVTHMHADHTLGLVPLLGSLLSGIQTTPEDRAAMAALGLKKKAKLHIYGPPGLRLMVRQILNLTSMTLGDAYAVHELIPNKQSVTGEAFNSTSPNGNGNEPSCECKEADLQIAEAVGRDIHADKDGCWKDILKIGEGQHGNEAQSWRVDAGPIKHRGK